MQLGAIKGKLNANAKINTPIFVDLPTPIFLFIYGMNGMESNRPNAVQNKAIPTSASFNSNFDLMCGK